MFHFGKDNVTETYELHMSLFKQWQRQTERRNNSGGVKGYIINSYPLKDIKVYNKSIVIH